MREYAASVKPEGWDKYSVDPESPKVPDIFILMEDIRREKKPRVE